jgi:hypothetical protein
VGKILSIVGVALFGILVICCVLGFFVGLPRVRDELQDSVQEAVATEVAQQIPAIPGIGAEPGTYTITEESLESSMRESADSGDNNDWQVRITPEQMSFGVVTSGRDATYTGVPAAENGQFVMRDMDTNNRFFDFILSPDDLGDAISGSVNRYLAENNLQLESLELQDGQIILTTVAAP